VYRNGTLIWLHDVRKPVDTGIEFCSDLDGLVSDFEAHEAAVYCHYTPSQFQRLSHDERAQVVAQYRLHRLVELHSDDAVNRKVDQEMAKNRRR
jgi:hypothetical protein